MPNYQKFFGIPAIATEDEEQWERECSIMLQHSKNTDRFLRGEISPQDYEQSIFELGFDPYALEELWSAGGSLV